MTVSENRGPSGMGRVGPDNGIVRSLATVTRMSELGPKLGKLAESSLSEVE